MRILQIEDDSATAQSCELMLKSEGFHYECTELGEEGLDLSKHYQYDIILLDLNLPDINGLTVLRRMREAKVTTPVMIVSDASDIETKVKALALGCDDYLTKPFHKEELIGRIRAIVRRALGHAQPTIEVGDLVLHLDDRRASVAGNRIHLTGKEYALLELLTLRRGATVGRNFAIDHLYGGIDEPELKIIDAFVCKLRSKIRAAGGQDNIETIWGKGFRMREPVAVVVEVAQ